MSQRQYEAYQVTAPFQGSTGLAAMANVAISQTAQAINLSDYFGGISASHFFTIMADIPGGSKAYVAVAPHDKQSIADNAVGAGPSVCFPCPDGVAVPFLLQGGRTIGTGGVTGNYATFLNYASGVILWAKVASSIGSGSATGYLRIMRNSMGPGQGLEQFPPRGFPARSS
jgi:hypothetical protein